MKAGRTWALACALLLGAAGGAAGQGGVLGTVIHDFEYGIRDILYVWSSPARMDAEDLEGLGAVLGTALLAAAFDAEIADAIEAHPSSAVVRGLERTREEYFLSRLGDTEDLMRVSAIAYAAGLVTGSRTLREAAMGCVSADYANSLLRHAIYEVFGRLRPGSVAEDGRTGPDVFRIPGDGWRWNSFPGGHAANAMSCVAYWNHRYDLGPAEPLLYALAGGVALGRMLDGRHWASDTVVGVAMGYAMGKTVAGRYERREKERGEGRPSGPPGGGLRLGFAASPGPALLIGWSATF